ncbi:hypothetical protein B566_EDAN009250 [Ephemera danica]|nr:hypothetical protein B566_EDAN009250 [Ephemera danica]
MASSSLSTPQQQQQQATGGRVAQLVRTVSQRARRGVRGLAGRGFSSFQEEPDGNTIRLAHLRVAKLQPKKAAANLSTKVAPSQSSDDLNDLARSAISLDAEPVASAGSCWHRNIDPQAEDQWIISTAMFLPGDFNACNVVNFCKCLIHIIITGRIYIGWLSLVAVACLYNCWVIPLRWVFPYQSPENTPVWIAVDLCADLIYLADTALVQPRLMFISQGLWVNDRSQMRRNYLTKMQFKMDIASLIPLDLLYFWLGTDKPYLRFPRFFKVHALWEFFSRLDSVLASPHLVRVARTVMNMLYMVHLNACAYYAFSAWEGLGSNNWTISNKPNINVYIRAFYFATKTATSIGKNPKPENEQEYLFMTCSWLMGVFVFALLIGQVRDIIATATRGQTEYRRLLDQMLHYLNRLNLPNDLQDRVKLWLTFTWQQQHTLDEIAILDTLPPKMKTDIALSVHIQTLDKVQLFSDCDPALIRDLVLKLRPVLYLPGDYVCRKGEVGKEMYIVKTGVIQVVADNDEVLATLNEGSVFGEISLLSIGSGNRRTADVRSQGFSNLFVLSKADLNEAIEQYPEAQEILKQKAVRLVQQNMERERQRELQSSTTAMQSTGITNSTTSMPNSTPMSRKTIVTVHK